MSKSKYLQKSQLLKLIDRLPGTIYQYREWPDGQCCFPYSTLAIEEIFFATPRELAKDGTVAWERMTPETRETFRAELKKSAKWQTEFKVTFQARSPQGRMHWIRTHAVPEQMKDGSTQWHGYMENITAQHEAENASKQQSALLQAIFENLKDSIYVKDRDLKVITGNRAWLDHLGMDSISQVQGRTDEDLFPAPMGLEMLEKEKNLLKTGGVVRERNKQIDRFGRQVYREAVKCPMVSSTGETIGIVGITRDVTSQVAHEEQLKKAKQQAEESATLFNAIFETLPDHIYYMDRGGRVIGANQACCKHHGLSAEEICGKTDIELYGEKIGRPIYERGMQVMESRKTLREREEHVLPNGRTICLETIKRPLIDHTGNVFGMAGISRDITSQVAHEEQLQQAKQQAEESASLINAIFESLPDQVYYKDAQARVIGGNKSWLKARSAEKIEDLEGKTDLDMHPAPLGQQLYDNEINQLKTGKVVRVRERHETPDGQIIYLESIKSPFRNQAGDIIGLVGISRDVTKQVKNERELILAQQEAEAANKAKSAFLAMMSHEIRTPMNGVIGASSLLLGTDLNEQQEEFVHTIQVSGENLMTIINDILDYSKIEAGKIDLEAAPFSLRECIENAFDLFVQSAAKKNLELLYYVEPEVPETLVGDSTRLRQIIVNLLGNAIKFTEEGEVDLQVHMMMIDSDINSCQLKFSVRDTGIGISEEAQEKLFQSFTQADVSSTRKYGGTGLGLAISRRLTELMGGDIWIDSTEGEGSVFHFTVKLPIGEAPRKRSGDVHAPQEIQNKRVLIVDDNETNRNILCAQIEQWGGTPYAFSHPEQVLQHLRQATPYDIALLDYHMPVMDGATLAKAIYKLPNYPEIPIIILSSSYETVPKHPSISARMAKPVKVNKLKTQMLQLLGEHHELKEDPAHPGVHIRTRKNHALRILVAEDNPINQRVVQMMLHRLGYENTVLVEDGQEAVAAAVDAEFDVILMDVQMPHMNGLDATMEIRKHFGSKNTPWIIALTAGVMEDERRKIMNSGMNEFLAKPLAVDQLEEKLDEVCEMLNVR